MTEDARKPAQPSAQMDAVLRLMTGKEERTIAEKFADSNRPTWEQYKKDNSDKLDIEGVEKKEMEAYRKELDEQRESILSRGINHGGGKKKSKRKKKYSDDSDSDDSRRRSKKRRRKHKKKKQRKHHRHSSESDDSSSDSDDSEDSRRRRKQKKKKKKHKRKSDKKDEGEDERYRLSNFFTQSSEDE